jgi:AbrB family looped-hinge helix DNA binding protein
MSTTVTQKGQVTIPKAVRDRLGIVPGTQVEFSLSQDGQVVLSKVDGQRASVPPHHDFARFVGRAGAGLSTDQIMALTRDT